VSVVLPVKGCRAHSARNWRSQLAQRYAGPLEFLFVVDDAADAAAVAVRKMLAAEGVPNARVVLTPHAVRASQKICNLMAGVRAAAGRHKWVLCLDDDIELHPRSLADLVAAAEAEPSAFMATGALQLTAHQALVMVRHAFSVCAACCQQAAFPSTSSAL
jgi:cellulose synthase/poly-beta-1,6-N-acetylglucosamine synthase-like glycosyltransferase